MFTPFVSNSGVENLVRFYLKYDIPISVLETFSTLCHLSGDVLDTLFRHRRHLCRGVTPTG